MKLAELDGQRGYYDEATDSFFPADTLKPAEVEGRRGLYHPETDTFFEADIPAPKEQPGLVQGVKDFFAQRAARPNLEAPQTFVSERTSSVPNAATDEGNVPPGFEQASPFTKQAAQTATDVLVKPLVKAPIEAARTGAFLAMPFTPEEADNKLGQFIDDASLKLQELHPDKDAGFLTHFAAGLTGLAPYLATGGAGASALLANSASRGVDAIDQGIDPKTATALAVKDLVTTAAFFKLPMAGKTLAGGMTKGAAGNVALDIASKAAEKGILTAADYDELAKQVSLADPESLAQAVGTGVVFGAHQTFAQQKAAEILARARAKAGVSESGQPVTKNVTDGSENVPLGTSVPEFAPETAPETTPMEPTPTVHGTEGPGTGEGRAERRKTENQALRRIVQEYEDRASTGDLAAIEEVKNAGVWKDTLTPMLNKRGYDSLKAVREKQPEHFWLDLDDFKATNDKMTHQGGDKVLESVGDVLYYHLGEHAPLAARWGGDEFTGAGAELGTKLESAREALANLQVPYEIPAGVEYPKNSGIILDKPLRVVQNGIKLSFGVGKTQQEAYNGNEANKQSRKEAGIRKGLRDRPADPGRTGSEPAARNALSPGQVAAGNRSAQGQPQEITPSPAQFSEHERAVASELRSIISQTKPEVKLGGSTEIRDERGEPTGGVFTETSLLPKHLRNLKITRTGSNNTLALLDKVEKGDRLSKEQQDDISHLITIHAGKMGYEAEAEPASKPSLVEQVKERFTTPVPSIDITPSMKSTVMGEGQELYVNPFIMPYKIVGSVGFALRKLGSTQIMDGIKRAFAPTLREGSEKVAAIMSEEVSRMERARDQFMHGMKEADKLFGKSSADANIEFMQRMDTGAKQQTPELQNVADAVDAMFKQKVKAIQDLGTGKLEQARENYFPHIWKQGEGDAVRKAANAALSRRPMEGSRAFLKHRVFDDVMAGIEAGYKPTSNNPLDLVALKMMEMDKYLITHHTMNALKADGLVKFVRLGQKTPEGFIKIDDRYGTVFAPKAEEGGAGPQLVGHYYAADPIGQVVNNYTSQNLYNNKYVGGLFSAYMGVANHLNQFQLGVFSAFHGGFTSMESVISQGALGLRQLSEGRVTDAAKSFVKTPFAWISNPARGNKLIKEWNTPGSQGTEMGQIIEGLMASGGRLHTLRGERFQTNDTKKLIEAWNRGTVGGKVEAVARSPLALVEQSARPILEWLVPRQKFGVFAEMAGDWLKNNPNASHEEMRTAMRQFWNRVDSRLGQVVYDRIFAHNVAKNVVQALVRAPGWTGGTILEVGGGAADAAKFVAALSEGKKPVMTDRMAYTLSLLMVTAAANGMLTYLFTGEKPKDKDFWAFRTGRKDEHGKDERFMLPTYAKDIWAYSQAPLTTLGHKTHPALSVGIDVAKNRDYYGNQIRDEDAAFLTQLAQTGKYAIKQFEPFWTRGARKASEQGKSVGAMAAPLVGVMPAPRSLTETAAEKKMGEISRGKGPVGGYTTEQAERRDLKRQLTQDYRQGDIKTLSGVIRAAREKGIELSDQEVENIREAKRPAGHDREQFQRRVSSFSAEEIMKVWQAMTPEEKKKYRHVVTDKVNNSETLTHRQKFDYRKMIREKGE